MVVHAKNFIIFMNYLLRIFFISWSLYFVIILPKMKVLNKFSRNTFYFVNEWLFLKFFLVCFIVFLVEIPDVIMTLQIYNSYVWVIKNNPHWNSACVSFYVWSWSRVYVIWRNTVIPWIDDHGALTTRDLHRSSVLMTTSSIVKYIT